MRRVCHILSGDLWAGAEVMAHQLLQEIASRKDISLLVILLNDGRLQEELEALDIPVRIVRESEHSFPAICRRVKRIIGEFNPDVIHAHRYKENLLAYFVSKRPESCRLISTQHGMPEAWGTKRTLRSRFITGLNFRLLRSRFELTVAVSQDIKDRLVRDYGFRDEKVRVIYNGILPGAPRMDRRPEGAVVVGSCGRLFPVKDYPLMVRAAHVVHDRKPGVRFKLAGDGPEKEHIKDLIHSSGLNGSFRLLGQMDDMDSFYAGLHMYMNTSIHEGIPMSILEAMNAGLPIIAPAVGGIREIVRHGTDGFLIKERTPERFAEACLKLAREPELRHRMAFAARERVRKDFSVNRMAVEYQALYET